MCGRKGAMKVQYGGHGFSLLLSSDDSKLSGDVRRCLLHGSFGVLLLGDKAGYRVE